MFDEAVKSQLDSHLSHNTLSSDWDLEGLVEDLRRDFHVIVDAPGWLKAEPEIEEGVMRERVLKAVKDAYNTKAERYGVPVMRHVEKQFLLQTLDHQWRDHLAAMDYLRQGIHLRGYAQKDYRYEYKREAFEMFTAMLERVKYDTVAMLAKVEVRTQEQIDADEAARRERLMQTLQAQHAEAHSVLEAGEAEAAAAPAGANAAIAAGGGGSPAQRGGRDAMAEALAPFVRGDRKVGRNEPCPCGSGKKFKHCHGALAGEA
jgi:preprotein translocase subunit SecA